MGGAVYCPAGDMTGRCGNDKHPAWLLLVAALCGALPVSAAGDPVLHERFSSSPSEDALMGATTLDGTMPAALLTRSGAVAAPQLGAAQSSAASAYSHEPEDHARSYQADADTRQPQRVTYSDPFTPTIPPFKRLFAYDSVDESFDLVVATPTLTLLPAQGVASLDDDQFYADLPVNLLANLPTRIPSVGPAARVLVARVTPKQDFALFHDGADNWFVQSAQAGSLQLMLQLAIDRDSFGSDYGGATWGVLRRSLPELPNNVRQAALDVGQQIGIAVDHGPGRVVRALVEYFRSFAPSEAELQGSGEDLYRALSLSQQGVCRHRAYAFVVTALGLGIPSRFVRNEAHAWVEVFDGRLWHRIDLGGAAAHVSLDEDERPRHVEPRDPYEWPARSNSAHAMTDRALREQAAARGSSNAAVTPSDNSSGGAGATGAPPLGASNEPSTWSEPGLPAATLSVQASGSGVRRGAGLRVSGSVMGADAPCDRVRVDLALRRGTEQRYALGTLVSDEQGRFKGQLVVPFEVPVGDYEIEASTPGRSGVCAPGHTP